MHVLGLIFGGVMAFAILIVAFTVYSKSRRLKEMMICDIDQLKDGDVHKEMIGDFKLTEDFKVKVITHFKDNNSKTTLGENNELIMPML